MFARRWIFSALTAVALGFPCITAAQNSTRWTTNYYAVTGMTIPELRRSIRETRPWKERFNHDAMTDWRVDWRFTVTATPASCRVSTFGTQTTIVITMPRWNAPTNATEATRQMWQNYVSALGRHEAGHGAMAVAAAAEMSRQVQGIDKGADCDALKTSLDAACKSVIELYRTKDRVYDETTRHGAIQGAVLPGGRRRPTP